MNGFRVPRGGVQYTWGLVSVSTSPRWVGSTCLRGALGTWCGKGCAAGCAWCPLWGGIGRPFKAPKRFRASKKSLMETPPQWHFSLICPKHLKGLTRTGSLNFSGSKEHRDGCMHMRNLFSFTAGSRTKCKEGSCPVEQSGKGSTWGGPSQCTFSAWLWTLCSPT